MSEKIKKLLIVVDYQNDFVTGSLGFPGAVAIEEAICEKIKAYEKEGQTVLFTLDTHYENYSDTQEGRKLPVLHCEQDSQGWQLYGKVKALKTKDMKTISKFTFGAIELGDYLRELQYDLVELVGVVTDICVISNAVIAKAALPEAEICVDARCVASNNPLMEEKALDLMENLQMQIIGR